MLEQYDQIILSHMVFYSHVGVLDFEKENGQSFDLDVTLYCQRIRATDTDELTETVDYGKVYQVVREVTEPAQFDLIERLAGAIADAVLGSFCQVEAVDVLVRKPSAPIEGSFAYMGVKIRRERG
jgi:dihydroneopterin aldolase